jgi:phosphoenolpyruvate carboxykinase (GTP)
MADSNLGILQSRMPDSEYAKLKRIDNAAVCEFIADAIHLCTPESVFICDDSPADLKYVREQAIAKGEETPLKIPGHTIHFDGMSDQGRDREVTRYLVPPGNTLSKALNQIEREKGLAEVRGLLKGAMKDRTMIVRFLTLGPTDSVFSIPCVQITDSFYVAHCEDLLYRPGYEEIRREGPESRFFHFLHSCGKLDENKVSCEPDKKRIYIDYGYETIYSVNTQYAGNTVGLKKLALRLTIRKADRENWLAEHMFLMGVHGPNGRKTYFAGAFPSACGKTSTAMLPGETIMGDDIAYLRNIGGTARGVNAERGIFGIIQDVNPEGDPAIYSVLSNPGEVIFSNVLLKDGVPYWLGMGREIPEKGTNFSDEWYEGKKDEDGRPIPPAHKNARYTVNLKALENVDSELDAPDGVEVSAMIYGGRDAHAVAPVQQSFGWTHGIVAYGASLETETTFAIVGAEGRKEINMMSIQDFLAIPFGKYVQNNLDFGASLNNPPLVFGVNYFLRNKEGKFLNGVRDKAVWIKWMERRVHGDMEAIPTPTGLIPHYEDLKRLFKETLGKEYSRENYIEQFTLRIPENLEKLDRIEAFNAKEIVTTPPALAEVLTGIRARLLEAQKAHGDYVSPFTFAEAAG